MRRHRPGTPHVVVNIRDQVFACLHCGATLPLPTPCAVRMFVAISNAFSREHASCKPQQPQEESPVNPAERVPRKEQAMSEIEKRTPEQKRAFALANLHRELEIIRDECKLAIRHASDLDLAAKSILARTLLARAPAIGEADAAEAWAELEAHLKESRRDNLIFQDATHDLLKIAESLDSAIDEAESRRRWLATWTPESDD